MQYITRLRCGITLFASRTERICQSVILSLSRNSRYLSLQSVRSFWISRAHSALFFMLEKARPYIVIRRWERGLALSLNSPVKRRGNQPAGSSLSHSLSVQQMTRKKLKRETDTTMSLWKRNFCQLPRVGSVNGAVKEPHEFCPNEILSLMRRDQKNYLTFQSSSCQV